MVKESNKMRVLSYNIHKGIGGRDRRYRLERIIEVIEDQNPNLICLKKLTEMSNAVSSTGRDSFLQNISTPKGNYFS